MMDARDYGDVVLIAQLAGVNQAPAMTGLTRIVVPGSPRGSHSSSGSPRKIA